MEIKTEIHKIELQIEELEDASELLELADHNKDMDVIVERNFTGDLRDIELYVSLTISLILSLAPIIKKLISKSKISSLKIDGDKIEIENVSEKTIEKILELKMEHVENKEKDKFEKKYRKK